MIETLLEVFEPRALEKIRKIEKNILLIALSPISTYHESPFPRTNFKENQFEDPSTDEKHP